MLRVRGLDQPSERGLAVEGQKQGDVARAAECGKPADVCADRAVGDGALGRGHGATLGADALP